MLKGTNPINIYDMRFILKLNSLLTDNPVGKIYEQIKRDFGIFQTNSRNFIQTLLKKRILIKFCLIYESIRHRSKNRREFDEKRPKIDNIDLGSFIEDAQILGSSQDFDRHYTNVKTSWGMGFKNSRVFWDVLSE